MARSLRLLLLISSLWAAGIGGASAAEAFFDSNGVKIWYIDEGMGEPVVLIHGSPSSVQREWKETGVVDGLAKSFRVIALDVRGYGKSDKPHDPALHGTEVAEDVVRLLDHLGIERAHVVGYSMGARIASWLIVHRPQRLITVTLGASTYYLDTPEQRRGFEASAKAFESGRAFVADNVARRNPQMTIKEAEAYAAEQQASNDPIAVAAWFRGAHELAITEAALSATRVPVLHIIGSKDESHMPGSKQLVENVLPGAKYVIVEGATHTGESAVYRRPEFVEAIAHFIEVHSQNNGN